MADGVFDCSIAPSVKHRGWFIACCCVLVRMGVEAEQCPSCGRGEHPQCSSPGYVESVPAEEAPPRG